ncbi:MAG: AAA family ATPase [Planctomycetia bacterium]|nr:AAA family ATPase [Planctomycetia bacterium]
MDRPDDVVLHHNDFYDVIRKRTLVRAFPNFCARSSAFKWVRVDPKTKPAQVLGVLEDCTIELSRWAGGGEDHVLKHDGHMIQLDIDTGCIKLQIHSKGADAAKFLATVVKRLEPFKAVEADENGVWADFCFLTKDGVDRRTEFLRCPKWEEISGNYPAPIRSPLDQLLGLPEPWKQGRLMVWHGPAGTGKTWAIRALMTHWRDRFDFSVVVDPEVLASHPEYYYEIASSSRETMLRRHGRHFDRELARFEAEADEGDAAESAPDSRMPRRRLFIMEDCADLIMSQSRTAHYDKIGKLLNMTDGLFGQGREDLFLITFNEEEDRIDPAFLRPGRCVANLTFPPFESEEAAAWLRGRGVGGKVETADLTLAQMYAKMHAKSGGDDLHPPSKGAMGFGAGK